MDKTKEKDISKKLSYVLRHKPQAIGIELDEYGWADAELLLKKLNITLEDLEYVVSHNQKKRFSFSENKQKIQANQGHSVDVNLELERVKPPNILFHGTAIHVLDSIRELGLKKMNRNHVHLSANKETAIKVGMRHGKPVILEIESGKMHELGYPFFISKNGVWLTEYVDPKFIKIPNHKDK